MPMDLPATGTVERARDQSGTLAQRISTSPDLADASAARAGVNDWLDEIADTAAGKTLIRLFAAHSRLNTLISGLAEGSRYLWELVRADPQRLVSLLEAEPERRFEEILADARAGHRRSAGRARSDASSSPHEGGGRAADRARRYRRGLAGDAGHRAANQAGRRRGRQRGRLPVCGCAAPRQAQVFRGQGPCGTLRLHRARHGQDGSGGAQLFERYRPYRILRRGHPSIRKRAGSVLRADHADAGEASATAHRRRLRLPHRSAAASRSRLDPDRGLHGVGARLLREPGAELGARRAHQGESLCRRPCGREGIARRALAFHLAQIPGLRGRG